MRDRDWAWGPINFEPGDVVTLSSHLHDIASVDVLEFDWAIDPDTEQVSGTDMPAGDIEVIASQWQSGFMPLFGYTYNQADILPDDSFEATFKEFDIRDGQSIELDHYNTAGNGNTLYAWGQPSLPYFELQLAHNAVSGWVNEGDTVTASLYNGATLLASTSTDGADDPNWFWLYDFGGHNLELGYKVVVTSGSWSAEMIVPEMAVSGDYGFDKITGSGPQGLLFMETYRDDSSLGFFIPSVSGSDIILYTAAYGYNLLQGDTIALTYQAPDGNRARQEMRIGDLYYMGHWFDTGARDWIGGEAVPGSTVTITVNDGDPIPTYFDDPNCDSCFGIHDLIELNPGDAIKVTSSLGSFITYTIPDPLTAEVDSDSDTISGQIGGRSEDWVQINTWWDGASYEVITDDLGNYSYSDTGFDVPPGGEGHIYFNEVRSDILVKFNQHFFTLDLYLNVNYDHDWIEGNYPAGYDVTLTVTESDGTTPKASTTINTSEIPWWGGGTGFSTNYGDVVWDPERPDIQPGDWVYGEVMVDETTTYYAQVHLGTITGTLDAETNTFTGTVTVPWEPPYEEIAVQCHPWGAPEGTPSKDTTVLPDGADTFTCDWTGEWDVEPGQEIAALYQDPAGHWVYSVHTAYTDELILQVHYDHDWIESYYEPGHEIYLQVLDGTLTEKAHITLLTDYWPELGSSSGIHTNIEGATWIPNHPDIQPGDTIHGAVDGALEFTADVKIGIITGDLDIDTEDISGTVDADWLPQTEEIRVICSIWENDNPGDIEDWVLPNGSDPYSCSWAGEYDVMPDTDLMVSYFEPADHQVIGDFSYPAPRLRIEKWLENGEPGVGGNVTFNIQYRNEGRADAINTIITDTMQGMTYLSDTSGLPRSVNASGDQVWTISTLSPGEWVGFYVTARVDALEGFDIINTAVISSDTPDAGSEEDRTRTWTGTVIANNTHLNVGKGAWTWNPAPGQDYVYNINVCNNGSTGSTEMTLTDTLPTQTTLVGWWGHEAGWDEEVGAEGELILTYPSIPGGSCREVYVRVSLDGDAQEGDELVNTAEIFASNDDPDEEDNWTELRHNVGDPYADLSIDMGWHGGSLVPGGQYAFGIYFNNYGNVPAESPIPITLTLPDGTDYIDWTYWDWAGYLGEPTVVGNTVTWLVDGLDPGFYGTIEVTLAIDPGVLPGTSLEHSATIAEHAMGETDTDNNAASFSEIVRDHGPNLRIRKWGDWHGDSRNAWYQLQVENIGDQEVAPVLVTDTLPINMELDGGIGVGYWEEQITIIEEGYFTVWLNRLEPGWSVGINFNTRVPDEIPFIYGDVFVNNASVGPNDHDTNIEDNSTSFELIARSGSAAHLKIQKSLIGDGVTAGGNAAFYVEYTNEGDLPAKNVTITDTLEGMTFIRDNSDLPVTVNTEGTVVTWTIETLDPGGWIGFFVFAEVTALEEAEISNTVVISSDTPDTGSEEERISTWSDFVAANNTYLNVGKDTWTWEPAAGQEFVYNVNVCNYGSTSSGVVTLTDTLPAWVEYNSFFGNDPDPGWQEISYNPATKTLVLEHTCISANTCSEVHIIAQVLPIAEVGTELVNTAVISGGNEVVPVGEDNTASITHNVGSPNPDLGIYANWNWGSLTPGGYYRYTIDFQNHGNLALPIGEDITIIASIPAGTSYAGWDKWGWGSVADPEVSENQVSWLLSELYPGFGGTLELWLDIDDSTAPDTILVNEVAITVQTGETNTENNTSVLEEMVYANGPNLRIRKFGGWAGSDKNDQYAWYHLEAENIGNETVENVDVRDDFPVEMTFTDTVRINDGNWTWDDTHLADHYFTASGRLEPGQRVDIDFDTRISWENFPYGQTFTNTASVTTPPGDTNPDDNSDSLDLTAGPDYYIDKSLDGGEFLPGAELDYRLTFGNQRNEYLLGVNMSGNPIITDTLPEGMSYVAGSSTLYWWGQDPLAIADPVIDGQVLTWTLSPLYYDQSHDLTYQVRLADEIDPDNPYINAVTVSSTDPDGDNDPYPENNTSSYTPELDLQKPEITSGGSATFRVGSPGSFSVEASGKPTPSISSVYILPAWLSLVDHGDGTATLSGTPPINSGAVYDLSFTASNGVMPDDTEAFTLTVQEAPYFTSADNATFKVGEFKTFTISALGYPAVNDITYTGSLPDGVSLVDNNDGTATLSGTPAALEGGVYTLTLTAINGVTPNATQTFTLTVNEAPKITSATSATFTIGSLSGFTVTTTGYPTPTLSKTGTLPNGVTFTPNPDGTATISGTPTELGTFPITIFAANMVLPDADQSFTLTVIPAQAAPLITSEDHTTLTVGSEGTFTVTTSGNPTPALSKTGTLPTGVTFTDNGDGTASLSGTPDPATGGVYPITITATNVNGTDTQTFTLTVNQAPAITSADNTTFVVGTYYMGFYVATTGYPTPSITGIGTLPAGIVFEDNDDGTARFYGTPLAGSEGDYTIDITASNGVGTAATQEFTLTVVPTPVAPTITSDPATTFTVGSADSFDITTTGYPLPSIAITGDALPTGLNFTDDSDGTARIWGTPATGMGGAYTLTITASNGVLPNATQEFTLTVNEAPTITSADNTTFTAGEFNSFTITTSGYPFSGILTGDALPSWLTLVDQGNGTAILSGTPPADTEGADYFTITASNGVGTDAQQSFTLTWEEPSGFTIFLPLILK